MLRKLETELALRHDLVHAYIAPQSGVESARLKLKDT